MLRLPPFLIFCPDARGAASRIADILSLPEKALRLLDNDRGSAWPVVAQSAVDAAVAFGANRAIVLLPHNLAVDLVEVLRGVGITRAGYVDPSAHIASKVTLSETAVVMENAKIQSRVYLGGGAFVDALCAVAYEVEIAEGAWIGPSATIGAGASIACGARVGPRATVAQNVSVGAHAEIGRATTVTEAMAPESRMQAPRARPLPADAASISTNLSMSGYRPVSGGRPLTAEEDLRHRRKYFD